MSRRTRSQSTRSTTRQASDALPTSHVPHRKSTRGFLELLLLPSARAVQPVDYQHCTKQLEQPTSAARLQSHQPRHARSMVTEDEFVAATTAYATYLRARADAEHAAETGGAAPPVGARGTKRARACCADGSLRPACRSRWHGVCAGGTTDSEDDDDRSGADADLTRS
jgi:hypothetical protein